MNEYEENYMEREPSSLLSRRIMDDISEVGNRPTPGFPLLTTLILFIVFGISALFSCCYHWEKIRTMHSRHHGRTSAHSSQPATVSRANFVPNTNALPLPISANFSNLSKNTRFQHQGRSSFPVVMPGDDVAKFIACPSPHGFASLNISDLASSQTNKSHT